ncbi:MAG: hypothetical protein J6C46_08605 [Clostridia bacterium]|nr:hypothetical protein [Clostridia bacterium]
MTDKYDEIFDRYKDFIENNSQYGARVVKYNTNTSTYFPLITCVLSDNKDTDNCTNDKIEFYESFYFTIDIYTKDKTKGNNLVVASQKISDELTKLTIKFFGEIMNMKRTLNRPTPNLDSSILRKTIQYQCLIGNVRGNIIRR